MDVAFTVEIVCKQDVAGDCVDTGWEFRGLSGYWVEI